MEPTNRAADADLPVGAQAPEPMQADSGHDLAAAIATLRERGADRLDPSRFRYIEALARRANQHHGALRDMLDQRLAHALAIYETRYEAARSELDTTVPALAQQYPQAAQALHRLHADGDARAVRLLAARLAAQAHSGPLADLVRHIDGQSMTREPVGVQAGDAAVPSDAAPMAELKTVQRFRDTWTRLRVDNQLTRSQEKIPENPGPLNSHLLVLRSLRRMQEVSPAYLERFMAHVDGLLWLEHAGLRGPAAAGKTVVQGGNKRKVRVAAGKSG